MPQEQKALVLRELEIMTRVRHPNVVQFLGFVDDPFCVLLEYLPMGDLKGYWRSHRLSASKKCRICIDVLKALAYLHNRRPSSIIHRDVKPTNVLMTESGVAKLSDFGLGRFTSDEDSVHGATAFSAPAAVFHPRRLLRRSREARRSRESKESSSNVEVVELGANMLSVSPSPSRSSPPGLNPAGLKSQMLPPKGSAKLRDATAVVGTAPYMAPEANSLHYDAKVDIYSAAVTFYELFEEASFDTTIPFGWAMTPIRFRTLIQRMGMELPTHRPSALDLIDLFHACKGRASSNTSVACTVS